MKVCACVLLFTIFAHTTNTQQQQLKHPNRNVNLALETILKFDKNQPEDRLLLKTVEKFVKQVKDVLRNTKQTHSRRNLTDDRVQTFTVFIQQIISILNTYDDNGFQMFLHILGEELQKYHYKGSKFHELTEIYQLKVTLREAYDFIKDKPASETRFIVNFIGDVLRKESYDSKMKDFVAYLNSLYTKDDEGKFHKVLKDLESYGRSKSWTDDNFVKVIREGVRALVFDHYSNLDTDTRKELKEKIASFWQSSKAALRTTSEVIFITDFAPTKANTGVKNTIPILVTKTSSSPFHKIGRQGYNYSDSGEFYKDISASNMKYKPSDESSDLNTIEESEEKLTEAPHTRRYATLYYEEISPIEEVKTTKSKQPAVFANVQRFKIDEDEENLALRAGKDDFEPTVSYKPRKHKKKYEKHAKSYGVKKIKTTIKPVQWNVSSNLNIMDSYKRVFESLKKIGRLAIDLQDSPTKLSRNSTTPPKSLNFRAFLNLEPQTTSFVKWHIGGRTKYDQTKFASAHVHTEEEISVEQFKRDLERERKHLRRSLSDNKGNLGIKDLQMIIERLNYLGKQIEELKQANALRSCQTNDKNQTGKCFRSDNGKNAKDDSYVKLVEVKRGSLRQKYNITNNTGNIVIRKCDKCNVSRLYRKVLKTNKTGLFHTNVKADQKMTRVNKTLLSYDRHRMRDTTSVFNSTQSNNKIIRDFNKHFSLDVTHDLKDGRKSRYKLTTSGRKSKSDTANITARSKRVLNFSSPPHYDIFHPSVVW